VDEGTCSSVLGAAAGLGSHSLTVNDGQR